MLIDFLFHYDHDIEAIFERMLSAFVHPTKILISFSAPVFCLFVCLRNIGAICDLTAYVTPC